MSESEDPELAKLVAALGEPRGRTRMALKRTQLAVDTPAPRLSVMVADQGENPTREALKAWDARLNGATLVDVAHQLGVSIELAKRLINEVHEAIYEDLKEALDRNRTLDLARIDGLLQTYYPAAKGGDEGAAALVLKALTQRAKLTGAEPQVAPTREIHPENVLIWIQQQMPSIGRIIESLPTE